MTMGITSPTSTTGQILKDGTPVISFDANNNATFAGTVVSNTPLGMRNRIINGDMRIDQRNAGASVSANGAYFVDRWQLGRSGGTIAASQSTTVPSNFKNSSLISVTTGYSIAAADQNNIRQFIEGFNVSDLGWGTASASTVTLSFWVRSSITGEFAGSLINSAYDRSYVFSYTISSANTWEQKSVTIAGDTSGTWLTDNSTGIRLFFDLGSGSNYNATAGAWGAGEKRRTSGAVQLFGTTGATFYITGVQLEVGSTATPFERRLYGQELINCQRYFQTAATGPCGVAQNTTNQYIGFQYPVAMRAVPTVAVTAAIRISDVTTSAYTQSSGTVAISIANADGGMYNLGNFTGLTTGRFAFMAQSGSGTLQLSAEL